MIRLELLQQNVPVPRFLEAELIQRALKLIDDPFLHEFLERVLPSVDRCQIVCGYPGERREQMPIPPKPLVYEILCILRSVLHHGCENRMTDLCVPGLVRLNTRDHLLKGMIGGSMRQRGETNELKVGEARF